MSLTQRLADQLIEQHPMRAARALERLGVEAAVELLARLPVAHSAAVIGCLAPPFAAALLAALPPEPAARVLDGLELDASARLLRRLPEAAREAVQDALPAGRARALRGVLRFPEATAGGLMDPEVLCLAEDLTALEALRAVRASADHAHYNLYVVDRQQRLAGVINLRELFQARPRARLSDVMVRDPQRLHALDDQAAVLQHPGWREVHSLPVVDDAGGYLGAVRYRTLRVLEEAARSGHAAQGSAAAALGELFAAGASGLLDALSPGTRGGSHGA